MHTVLKSLTEQQLGQKAVTGDRDAFEEIVRRYSRPLAEFAAGRTVSWQDAEDIAQETFLRAYVNISSFNPEHSLRQWLYTIAYRLMVSSWRKKKTVRLSDEAAALLAQPQAADSPYDPQELWEAVRKAGDEAYSILWLRYRQEMPIEEIAKITQKTNIGVRVLLHRTRRKLAQTLKQAREQDTTDFEIRPAVYSERGI